MLRSRPPLAPARLHCPYAPLHQDVMQSAGVRVVGDVVLTVKLTSAAKAHLQYTNTYTQTVTRATTSGGVTSTTTTTSQCKGVVSKALKRVA